MSLNNELDEIIAAAKRDMLFVDSNSGKILIRYRMQDGRVMLNHVADIVPNPAESLPQLMVLSQ